MNSPLQRQPNLLPDFIFPGLLGNVSGRDDNMSCGNSIIAIPELLGNISGHDDNMSCDSSLDRLYLEYYMSDDIPAAFTINLKPSSSGSRDDFSRASIDNLNQVMPAMALGEGNESMTGYELYSSYSNSCDDSSRASSIDNRPFQYPPVDDDTVLSQSTVLTFPTKAITFSDIFSRLHGHTLQADQEYFAPPSTAAMTRLAPPLGELVGICETHDGLLLKKDQATQCEIVESLEKVYMVASIALAVETEKQDGLLWYLLKKRYGRSVPTSVIQSVNYKHFLKSCDGAATGAESPFLLSSAFDRIGFEVYVMFDSLKRIFAREVFPTELDMMDCLIVAMTRRCFLPEVGTSDTTSQSSLEPNDGRSSPGISKDHNLKLQLLKEYKKESDIMRYSCAYMGHAGIWQNAAVWKKGGRI